MVSFWKVKKKQILIFFLLYNFITLQKYRALEIQEEHNEENKEKEVIESLKKNVSHMLEHIRTIDSKNVEK